MNHDDRPDGVRLQKVLAQAGVASRRASEELIAAGRVSVDGKVVREMGRRVDPDTAVVHVDGNRVVLRDDLVHLALNKPFGMLSTMSDEQGLLLLTNDGELGHRLMHPSFEVSKTYVAKVHGNVARDVGKRLREGVELDDGLATVDSFKLVDNLPGHSMVEVVLHEGRKHIVRRLLDAVGYPVEQLVRTAIGEVTLGNQRPGKVRPLTVTEIGQLYRAVGL